MLKNLVVGSGFSGATIANLIADKLGEEVTVVERRNHIAGNSFDFKDENNITIHKYGSHIFHTNSDKVWNFLRQFGKFNQYMHKVYAVIDGNETTIPFNFNTLYDVFPQAMAKKLEEKLLNTFKFNNKVPILEFLKQDDEDLKFLANYVYEKVFLHYTSKQWGVSPDNIDSMVTARVPVYLSKDNRYFQDKYQGIPLEGYSKLVQNMLSCPNISVKLNSDFKSLDKQFIKSFDRIFYTGSIDEYFDYKYGELPYRSLNFDIQTINKEFYQKTVVTNYPNNYDFTRITEHK